MRFPLDFYFLALGSAAAVGYCSTPLWRRWCVRVGLVDDPGHRKIHSQPIPLAGGLAVMTAIAAPVLAAALLLWLLPDHARAAYLLKYGMNRRALELASILAGAAGMLAVGFVDDKYELKPRTKFAGQLLVAALVAASGVRITLFVPSALFSYAITILWILTVINAFNFMDNMNGLCAGLGAIAAAQFALVAGQQGQYLVTLIACLMSGALLGFLPHNFPSARAFLGDAGSHLVGYLLAVLAILPHFHTLAQPRPWAVLIPLAVLAVPLGDMAWVVVLRWRIGQPFYQGDTNHLSHRLVKKGLSRTKAVLCIWCTAAAVGGLVWLL